MFESIPCGRLTSLSQLVASFDITCMTFHEEDYSNQHQNTYDVQIRFSAYGSGPSGPIRSYHFMICLVVAMSNPKSTIVPPKHQIAFLITICSILHQMSSKWKPFDTTIAYSRRVTDWISRIGYRRRRRRRRKIRDWDTRILLFYWYFQQASMHT